MDRRIYHLDRPPPPAELKRYFNQRVIPIVIDVAGHVESALERLAVQTRRQPTLVLGLALSAGFLLSALAGRRMAQPAATDAARVHGRGGAWQRGRLHRAT
jgi:hypothetical protein